MSTNTSSISIEEGKSTTAGYFDPAVFGSIIIQHQSACLREMGEFRLILAVLEDAMRCIFQYYTKRSEKEKELFDEAEEWIMSNDVGWGYSYRNICNYLELDPNWIRRGIKKWLEAKRAEMCVSYAQHKRAFPRNSSKFGGKRIVY